MSSLKKAVAPSHGEVKAHYENRFARADSESAPTTGDKAVKVYPVPYHNEILAKLDPRLTQANFGCGAPIPAGDLSGLTVVDLGCGLGRDVYVLSGLVGEDGRAIGVDMLADVLTRAREVREPMRVAFEYAVSNVEFLESKIEDMGSIPDGSVDLVVSNCVLNLTPDKWVTFAEISRILKPGGELFFSDVYCSVRMPAILSENKGLWGGCFAGALYLPDFQAALRQAGLSNFHIVRGRVLDTPSAALDLLESSPALAKALQFYSFTMRVFKLAKEVEGDGEEEVKQVSVCRYEGLESNYGQQATFLGDKYDDSFEFDYLSKFEKGVPKAVSGDLAELISHSHYARFFEVTERREHLGRFSDRPASFWEIVDKVEATSRCASCRSCCSKKRGED